jgi:hypothetical protein
MRASLRSRIRRGGIARASANVLSNMASRQHAKTTAAAALEGGSPFLRVKGRRRPHGRGSQEQIGCSEGRNG